MNKKIIRIIAITLKLIVWAIIIHFLNYWMTILLMYLITIAMIGDIVSLLYFWVFGPFSFYIANPISFVTFFMLHYFFNKKGAFSFSMKSFVILFFTITAAFIGQVLLYVVK